MYSFYNPGQFFGPDQMLWVYKNLPCDTPDGPATVAINNYRNATHKKAKPTETDADTAGTQDAEKIKNYLLRVAPDHALRAGGVVAFVEVFLGKGSPQAICAVLQMFVDYAEPFIALSQRERAQGAVAQCANYLDDINITWPDTLQLIADKWLGLDCNGFVGNWLTLVAPQFKLNQNSKTRNVLPIARAFRTLKTIEYWDLMCYAGNEHIAVVNDVNAWDDSSLSFNVCQSAGKGPSMDTYSFLSAGFDAQGRQLFKLASPKSTDIGTVFYVVSLW